MKPTEEQEVCKENAVAGRSFKVAAFAGTGKTSTGTCIASALPRKKMTYVAFNRSLADEGKEKFPANVKCITGHGLAFRSVGRKYQGRISNLISLRQPIREWYFNELLWLQNQYSRDIEAGLYAVMGTLEKFTQSGEMEFKASHVPAQAKMTLSEDARAAFCQDVTRIAEKVWHDMINEKSDMPITHDTYLKIWQLQRPLIPSDIILHDEAQDANPVMLSIIESQADAQRIHFGDKHQQIYSWRGAINAMSELNLPELPLTQSFRFGESIAEMANHVLSAKGEFRLLRGTDSIQSEVFDDPMFRQADAILCRSNMGVILEVEEAICAGLRPAVVGGIEDACRLLEAAYRFYLGEPPRHPELNPFNDWAELEAFAESEFGSMYAPIVKMVQKYGHSIPSLINKLRASVVDESEADIVITTAHRAKGREWPFVRLAEDFHAFAEDDKERGLIFNEEEANLIYVAMTRARNTLNTGGFRAELEESIQIARAIMAHAGDKAKEGVKAAVAAVRQQRRHDRRQGHVEADREQLTLFPIDKAIQGESKAASVKRQRNPRGKRVSLPPKLVALLEAESSKAGVSVEELAAQMLTNSLKGTE